MRQVAAPWIEPDELEYSEMAKSFAAGGHFLFRTQPSPLFSLYAALIAPAWRAASMHTTYEVAKSINVVVMTAAAVPFYVWGRRLAGGWWAVVGTALFLALPSFFYSGYLMTENAALPFFMLSFLLIALMLERPTPLRQVLALVSIGLSCSVRYQGLVLILVLLGGILLKLALDASVGAVVRSRRGLWLELRRYWLAVSLIAAAALAYGLLKVAEGQPLSSGLRAYAGIVKTHYSVREVLRWSVIHAGELTLAVGVIPACALVVLLGLFRSRWQATAAERAYLAVTLAAVPLILVQVGAFASGYSLRIEERNMLYLEPLLLLALVIWLARGLPRPSGLVALGVLVPAALLVTLPLESLFNDSILADTFGLTPYYRLSQRLSGGLYEVRTLMGLGAIGAGALFAVAPRRVAVWAAPLAVGILLVLSSRSVFGNETFVANAAWHAGGLTSDPSWIDHAVGRDSRVEFADSVYITDPHILWQAEFWNRSVRRVFGVTSNDPSIPDVNAPLDPATGLIHPQLPAGSPDLKPRYVVTGPGLAIAGKRIAQGGFLSLYRVSPPLGLAGATSGVNPDGWTGASATYVAYRTGAGSHVEVTLSRPDFKGPPPAHVTVSIGSVRVVNGFATLGRARAILRTTVKNDSSRTLRLTESRSPFLVQVNVTPTFSPATYGSTDTRTLGVLVSFRVR